MIIFYRGSEKVGYDSKNAYYLGQKVKIKIHLEVLTTMFSCNYNVCKGHCCKFESPYPVGGYLTKAEHDEIATKLCDKEHSQYKYLRRNLFSYPLCEYAGQYFTATKASKNCVYSDDVRNCCALETAYKNGDLSFPIPAHCSLFPLTVDFGDVYTIAFSEVHDECAAAFRKGEILKISAWEFVKPSIVRLFGENFYETVLIRK